MNIDYRRSRGSRERIQGQFVSNFYKGEKTIYEADRMGFDSMQKIVNFYSSKGNAVLRRGISKLSNIDNLKGLFMYKADSSILVGDIVDTDTNIVSIDKSTGATTDLITGVTGVVKGYFEELRGILYYTNEQNDIQVWDNTASSTLTFDYGAGAMPVGMIASDESHLWGVSLESPTQVLVFSKNDGTGKVTTFNTGGSTIDRSGIASSKIKKFTGLIGVNKSIIATGTDSIEVHRIPDFAKSGITSFPLNVSTLLVSYDNIGIENNNAIVKVGNSAFLKGKDNKLYKVRSDGKLNVYTDELGLWDDIDWTKANMAYDLKRNLIYITGTSASDNDITGVFNLDNESFSSFDNIYSEEWAFDRDGLYFLSDESIYRAFNETDYTDEDISIQWELLTQATYGSTKEFYKKLREIVISFQMWEDLDIKVQAIINRGTTSSMNGVIETESEVFDIDIFSSNPQSFNSGVWGGANIEFNSDQGLEKTLRSLIKNKNFHRLELRITGNSKAPFEFKEIGAKYVVTAKKVKRLQYD